MSRSVSGQTFFAKKFVQDYRDKNAMLLTRIPKYTCFYKMRLWLHD